MSQDISGFGTLLLLTANITYPTGVPITAFADDSDGIDFPSIQIADGAMTVNGILAKWKVAKAIDLTLNVLAGSPDDENLTYLLEANRPAQGKLNVSDIVGIVATYPNLGITATYVDGFISDGMPGTSLSSVGRLKTKTYMFKFQTRTLAAI
jgi:hypothetical protein